MLRYDLDILETAHPPSNTFRCEVRKRSKEVSAVLSELRITESQEFEVSVTDSNAISHYSLDASKHFVICVCFRRIDSPLLSVSYVSANCEHYLPGTSHR